MPADNSTVQVTLTGWSEVDVAWRHGVVVSCVSCERVSIHIDQSPASDDSTFSCSVVDEHARRPHTAAMERGGRNGGILTMCFCAAEEREGKKQRAVEL